jgi:hypothetical protein
VVVLISVITVVVITDVFIAILYKSLSVIDPIWPQWRGPLSARLASLTTWGT